MRHNPKDGEIGVISANSCSLDSSRVEKASQQEDILLSPAPHPHWTIRECLQQPEAIARALAFGGAVYIHNGTVCCIMQHGIQVFNTTSRTVLILHPVQTSVSCKSNFRIEM